jgi:di/tricarboxylate transporter
MGISLAAYMSLAALLVVVVLSAIKEDYNPGIIATALAILVGGFWANMSGAKVMNLFPVSLFMILAGVTFMFAIATVNGTMEKFTAHAVRSVGGHPAYIPLLIFLLVVIITTIGPGNIASVALMAPVMMALAGRIGISGFAMTLLVVGAANAAAFSPYAPTGIISNELIAKMAPKLAAMGKEMGNPAWDLAGRFDWLGWKIYLNSTVAQGIVNIGGFLIFGGFAWIRSHRSSTFSINEIAPRPEPYTGKQKLTLAMIFLLVVLVVLAAIPGVKVLTPQWALNPLSNVGSVAFILAAILMVAGAADVKAAVHAMPWFVILMVCGVTVLIEVLDKTGGLAALVKGLATISTPLTIHFWLGLFTGAISAYSSSSGVVMPMFLPLVPGLLKALGPATDAIGLISSINVGSHLVDTSPLSTLGALCIACAAAHEDKTKLFRKLLLWGLSMSVVGAVVCLVFFGILGL